MFSSNARSPLAVAIASAVMLAACGGGGGGGNVRPDAPPTTPPPPPPPSVCTDPNATNNGGPLPCTYRYNGAADNLLVGTGTDLARSRTGATGAGVRVGLLDGERPTGSYPTLDGQVASYRDYTTGTPSTRLADHGPLMGSVIAGKPLTGFNGGVAPGASLYWARVCQDGSCQFPRIGQAFNDLLPQGVRLFNLSLGTTLADDTQRATAASNFDFYARPVLNANGLIVAATGNDAGTVPSSPALTPHFQSQWRNNMLAVGAVDLDSRGIATGLSSFSNQCGLAAQWCLVAPGAVTLPILAGGNGQVTGTSVATASVTGVAALVWQRYPWMTGAQVQGTLLTTARDLGAAGVDSVFGWGLVDANRAVFGPGQFLATFIANTDAGSYTFGNDISGVGGLTKRGAGTLLLTGQNTYAGATSVEQGTLALSGRIAGNVSVGSGATFASQGGRVGSYSAGTGSTTAIQVGTGMTVDNAATVAGTLQILNAPTTYTIGARERLLTAGTLNGRFGNVTYGNGFFYTATLDYTATELFANLTRASASGAAMASGAQASVVDGARQVDALLRNLDQRVADGRTQGVESLVSAAANLMASDRVTAEASLASLTGQVHGTQRTFGVQGALNDNRIAADRLPLLKGTEGPTGWVQLDAVDGTLKRDGYASADYNQYGLTVGVDVPLGDEVLVGFSITNGRDSADVAGASLETRRNGATAYVYAPVGRGYVAAVAGGTGSTVDTSRTVQFGAGSERIAIERDEGAVHARIEGGVKLDNGINPFAAVGAVRHTQEAFSEGSASGLGLSADEDTATVRFADLGVRFDHTTGAWELGGLLAYRRVLGGEDTSFDAWFTGLPAARFQVNGQPVARDSVRAMVGAAYNASKSTTLYGGLGLEKQTDQGSNTTVNLGVRWSF